MQDPRTNLTDPKDIEMVTGRNSCGLFLWALIGISIILSCSERKELVDQELYTGPLSSMDSIDTYMSDSAELVMHMKAPRQNDFESGDTEWPHGLFLESFGDEGETKTSFRANYVYFFREDNLYQAQGNVVVKNLANGDELNTEELFWSQPDEEFYTEKFVTIKSDDEVHTGEGLKANQDFTSYRILKPTGSFLLEDEERESF